ncbi:glycine cleavage system protein GcvH [Silvanigrella aquatica]|uniref:Glycine cleavage system H protein n=1 Tax=Silvanigrella aquatica TaxID=1915309 RepID=A0A1L4D3Z5_9BACT|nr:glycine cleavage system protein GcvH [Silvanigrella aquatica]APJ04934.1 glycine cleavage system protein H [Silvanigrella aquatica]
MSYPNELKYTKEHEWIKIDGKKASIGVTKFAIDQLGDVVFLELPKVGTNFNANDAFGTIESTKTVSELYAPATCKVVEINTAIVDAPENLSQDAYQNGWLIKVEIDQVPSGLLSASEYEKYISEGV